MDNQRCLCRLVVNIRSREVRPALSPCMTMPRAIMWSHRWIDLSHPPQVKNIPSRFVRITIGSRLHFKFAADADEEGREVTGKQVKLPGEWESIPLLTYGASHQDFQRMALEPAPRIPDVLRNSARGAAVKRTSDGSWSWLTFADVVFGSPVEVLNIALLLSAVRSGTGPERPTDWVCSHWRPENHPCH